MGDVHIAVHCVLGAADIHSSLIDLGPVLGNTEDALDGPEHTQLLEVAGGLGHTLTPFRKGGAINGNLAQRGPHGNLRCIAVLFIGQLCQDGVTLLVKALESLQAMLGRAVCKDTCRLRVCGVFAGDRQGLIRPGQTVVNAIGGAGKTIVGLVLIACGTQGGPRCRRQVGVPLLQADGGGLTSVSDGRSLGGHAHTQDGTDRKSHGHNTGLQRFSHEFSPFGHKNWAACFHTQPIGDL